MTPPAENSAVPDGWLEAALRRKVTYLHLQELWAGRDVVELWSGAADARGAELLRARGARRVTVVAAGGGTIAGAPARTGLPTASAELVLALDIDPASLGDVVREARRVLRADGLLVLGLPSRDRPGVRHGASYYDVVDACGMFERVQMIGLAPFAGATLVEYGVADPEPILDGTLVERGERVEHYIAVAGPERRGDFGYGVVQVPLAEVLPAARPAGADDHALRAIVSRLEAELAQARRVPAPASPPRDPGAREAELAQALDRHLAEARARAVELAERDAYIRELEPLGHRLNELLGQLARAESARVTAEAGERAARRAVAELEGRALRAGAPAPAALGLPAPAAAPADATGAGELGALKHKLAAAEAESWKQMKARSDAEAAVAEMRDDMVRKLKDARKLATVELTRAMEEATKKAVSLREELSRSEAERKAALERIKALEATAAQSDADAAHRRELARAREEGDASALAAKAAGARALSDAEAARLAAEARLRESEERATQLQGRVVATERALAETERARDEARAELAGEKARLQALTGGEVAEHGDELAARARAEAEHGQAAARLRGELLERDRRLQSLERNRPPRAEVERVRAEHELLRGRLAELELELQRRGAVIERTASVAAHERARSERLVASERQALAERNDARARGAEAQARVAAIEADRDRAIAQLAAAQAKLHKAENEIEERRERVRRLKRELAESERRSAAGIQRMRTLETVRARVAALEAAVAVETRQLVDIEQALRAP